MKIKYFWHFKLTIKHIYVIKSMAGLFMNIMLDTFVPEVCGGMTSFDWLVLFLVEDFRKYLKICL